MAKKAKVAKEKKVDEPELKKEDELDEEEEGEEVDAEGGEDEDGDGDPDKLPVQYQAFTIAGKAKYFPLFFVAASKDGKRIAGFNEKGVRVTPWTAKNAEAEDKGALPPAKKIAKDVARSNALRRRNMLPDDYLTSAPGGAIVA